MVQWLASFYSSIGSYLAGAFMSTVTDLNNFVATRCAIADISLADFGRKEITQAVIDFVKVKYVDDHNLAARNNI